jgi:hypothetical protein
MISGDVSPRIVGQSLLEVFTHRSWLRLVERTTAAAGDEYLNWVFGYQPDLGDLKTLIQVLSTSTKRITQYYSDSNKFVRRKFYYPAVQTYDAGTVPYSGVTGIIPSFVNSGSYSNWPVNQINGALVTSRPSASTLLVERSAITRTWFKGEFLYSLAVGKDLLSRMERWGQVIDKLTGARVTLESFYNAVPFSWMLDWFTDIGDIIANGVRSEFNNEILRYGYLMEHVRVQKTYTLVGPFVFANGYRVPNLSITYVSEKKERVRATPFGFGIDPGAFSASQIAILAALGISKGQGLSLPGKFGGFPRY